MNLFGKPRAAAAPAAPPVDTIAQLRSQLSALEKREALLDKRIQECINDALAKQKRKDTKGALFELKRKKMFTAEIEKIQGARITMETQILALESASMNVTTVRAMKQGADAMKSIHGNLDVDKVEDILENIQEQKDIHDAISEAISRPGQDLFDDEDMLNELQELEAAQNATSVQQPAAAAPTSVFNLPSAPTHGLAQPQGRAETDEERELRELEASLMLA